MNAIHYSVNSSFGERHVPKISLEQLQDRRDEIVAAARMVFSVNGFDTTAISDIARSAGTSDGLIYRYFNSKRELLAAVLESFYGGVVEEIEAAIAARGDYRSKLAALIECHVGVFAQDSGLCRLFISEVRNLDGYVGSSAQALNRRYTALLSPVIDLGVAEGALAPGIDRRLARDMLFGGIEHIAWRHISTGTAIDVPRIAAMVTALFVSGLGAL